MFLNSAHFALDRYDQRQQNATHGLFGCRSAHFSSHHPALKICQPMISPSTSGQRLTASVLLPRVLAPDIEVCMVPVLASFLPATIKEISNILNKSTPKHCELDPLSTWLLKKAEPILAPALCHLRVVVGGCSTVNLNVNVERY